MINIYSDKEILQTLGERIKSTRKTLSYTQQELADQIGVTRQAIGSLEKGGGIGLLYFVRIIRFYDLEQSLIDLIPENNLIAPYNMS